MQVFLPFVLSSFAYHSCPTPAGLCSQTQMPRLIPSSSERPAKIGCGALSQLSTKARYCLKPHSEGPCAASPQLAQEVLTPVRAASPSCSGSSSSSSPYWDMTAAVTRLFCGLLFGPAIQLMFSLKPRLYLRSLVSRTATTLCHNA